MKPLARSARSAPCSLAGCLVVPQRGHARRAEDGALRRRRRRARCATSTRGRGRRWCSSTASPRRSRRGISVVPELAQDAPRDRRSTSRASAGATGPRATTRPRPRRSSCSQLLDQLGVEAGGVRRPLVGLVRGAGAGARRAGAGDAGSRSTTPGSTRSSSPPSSSWRAPTAWARCSSRSSTIERPDEQHRARLLRQGAYVTERLVEDVERALERPGTDAAALAAVRGQRFTEQQQQYRTIEQPALLLWGREDEVTHAHVRRAPLARSAARAPRRLPALRPLPDDRGDGASRTRSSSSSSPRTRATTATRRRRQTTRRRGRRREARPRSSRRCPGDGPRARARAGAGDRLHRHRRGHQAQTEIDREARRLPSASAARRSTTSTSTAGPRPRGSSSSRCRSPTPTATARGRGHAPAHRPRLLRARRQRRGEGAHRRARQPGRSAARRRASPAARPRSSRSRPCASSASYGEALTPIGVIAAGRMGSHVGPRHPRQRRRLRRLRQRRRRRSHRAHHAPRRASSGPRRLRLLGRPGPRRRAATRRHVIDIDPTADVHTVTLRLPPLQGRPRPRAPPQGRQDHGRLRRVRLLPLAAERRARRPTCRSRNPVPITASQVMYRGYNAGAVDALAAASRAHGAHRGRGRGHRRQRRAALAHPGRALPPAGHGAAGRRRARERVRRPGGRGAGGLDGGLRERRPGARLRRQLPLTAPPAQARGPRRRAGQPAGPQRIDNFRFHPDYRIDRILFREIIGTRHRRRLRPPARPLEHRAPRRRATSPRRSPASPRSPYTAPRRPAGRAPSASSSTPRSPTARATASAPRSSTPCSSRSPGSTTPCSASGRSPAQLIRLRLTYSF